MKDADDYQFVLALIGCVDDDVGKSGHDPFQRALNSTGVTHQRKARQLFDILKYPVNDAGGGNRTIMGYPGGYPFEVSERRIADDGLHAPEWARRARTSASVRNFGLESARRRSISATCSPDSR